MSMRSEGVILGAGSNPTAAASGRSHGPTFFHPYRFPSSPESLYMHFRNSRPGAAFEIGIAALSRSSRGFLVSLCERTEFLPFFKSGESRFEFSCSRRVSPGNNPDLNDLSDVSGGIVESHSPNSRS